jgi:hypothetical protein
MAETDALRARRRAAAAELQQLLTAEPVDARRLADLRERVETIDLLLTERRSPLFSQLKPLLVVGVAAGAIVTWLLTWKADFVPVQLEIEARALSAQLREEAELTGVLVDQNVQVRGVAWIESPRFDAASLSAAREFAANAGWMRIQRLTASKDATLGVERGAQSLVVTVTRRPATLELLLRDAARMSVVSQSGPGGEFEGQFSVAEPVRMGSAAGERTTPAAGLELSAGFAPDRTAQFVFEPRELTFLERVPQRRSGVEFASSIVSGTISFDGIERRYGIEEGDVIDVRGFAPEAARVSIGATLRLRARGTAQQVSLRRGATSKSLAPSMLEFLAQNHTLALAWGAVGLISGFLWSAFRFFKR